VERHPSRTMKLTLSMAVIAAFALAACSGSGTPTASNTTVAPSNASSNSPITTAAPTATTGAPIVQASSPAALPSNACQLLTDQEASQLAGGPVTGQPGPQGLPAKLCVYRGTNRVTLTATAYPDVAAAHSFVEALLTSLKGLPAKVSGVGDETYQYSTAGVGGFGTRRGTIVFVVLATGSNPSADALTAAAKSVLGRL
jgi:hypothetical protein